MRKKKLLYILNVDRFLITHRLEIALAAKKNNFEVHVGTKITDASKIINSRGINTHEIHINRSSTKIIDLLKTSISIYNLIKRIKPDIVHFISIKPVILGSIISKFISEDIALIASITGLGYIFTDKTFYGKIKRIITCQLYKIALSNKKIKIIFQNSSDKVFIQNLCKIDEQRCYLIKGSGVNLKKYRFTKSLSKEQKVLLPARIVRSKGIIEFIKAAKLLKGRARFIICGDYDLEAKDYIDKDYINKNVNEKVIEHWGFMKNMNEVFTESTIVVLPSYREGLPKALCEASASGKPIVTTDVPGCRDSIINEKTGFLIPPRNHFLLMKAIDKLLKSESLRLSFGIEGRKYAEENFDILKVIKTHMLLYLSSCNKVF